MNYAKKAIEEKITELKHEIEDANQSLERNKEMLIKHENSITIISDIINGKEKEVTELITIIESMDSKEPHERVHIPIETTMQVMNNQK